MKNLTTILLTAAASVAFATNASNVSAQEEDEDMFAEDTDEGFVDDSGGETDDGAAEDTMEEPTVEATSDGVAQNGGTLGLGFTTTTSGTSGVEAEYWISPTLMATVLGRISYLSGDGGSLTGVELGAGAMIVLKDRGKAALLVGGRFLVGFASFSPDMGESQSTTSIAIEAPLRLQMALHPSVSAHLEGGVAISIGDQAGLGGDEQTSFGFGIGTNNLFGQAGLTFYFD